MKERPQGIGLLEIRERVSLVGATLDVNSAPGTSTPVSLRYPIPSSAEPAATGA